MGALASVVAIGFATWSLLESQRVRRAAIREQRFDRAENRLRAMESIALLIGQLTHRNPSKITLDQREIRLRVVGNRLAETLPTVTKLALIPGGHDAARKIIQMSQAAQDEVEDALVNEAKTVEALLLEGLDAPLGA